MSFTDLAYERILKSNNCPPGSVSADTTCSFRMVVPHFIQDDPQAPNIYFLAQNISESLFHNIQAPVGFSFYTGNDSGPQQKWLPLMWLLPSSKMFWGFRSQWTMAMTLALAMTHRAHGLPK